MGALGIPRGVYTSTIAVFSDTKGAVPDEHYRYEGPHLSEYDRTKWIAHYRVAQPKIEQGLPLSIVMPGVVYGPGDTSGMHTALVDLLRGRLPMTPARTAFCWAHVEDTARAPHSRDGARQTGRDLHHRRSAAHVRIRIRSCRVARQGSRAGLPSGPHAMRAMAAATSAVGRVVTLPPAFTPEALRVLAGTTYFGSNEKAVRELGYSPRPLEEGMAQTLEHELRLLGRA